MSRVKRLYFYLVAYAGLGMLLSGLGNLGELLLEHLAGGSTAGAEHLRDRTALGIALTAIGLPAWLLHWWAAERWLREPLEAEERRSGLRRLFLYAVLATCGLVAYATAREMLAHAFGWPLGLSSGSQRALELFRPAPYLLLAVVFWAYHWRVAGRDRRLAGEVGASATLRRWYLYGMATLGVVPLMLNLADIGQQLWSLAVGPRATAQVGPPVALVTLAESSASALVALGVWLVHRGWAEASLGSGPARAEDERHSVLRKVYLYALVAGTVAWALTNASQVVRYLLLSALGVAPSEVGGEPIGSALGRPLVTIVVFGCFWAYFWRAVRREAAQEPEVGRQAGVRRLYSYLVAGVSLAILVNGVSGLLRLLVDVAILPPSPDPSGAREALATNLSMLAIALPVWWYHWRSAQRLLLGPRGGEEARSTTRRWYLYLAAFASVVAVLIVGAWLVYDLTTVALGRTLDRGLQAEVGRLLVTGAVAGAALWYHWWLVLRADLAALRHATPGRTAVAIIAGLDQAQAERLGELVREHLDGSRVKLVWTDEAGAREAVARVGQAVTATGCLPASSMTTDSKTSAARRTSASEMP